MKKHLLFVSAILLGSGAATAQTWTFADEAEIDDATTMYAIDSNAVNYANLTGADQTWDYSNYAGYSGNDKVIDLFDASTGAFAAEFPNSTHQLVIPGFSTMFYTIDANEKSSQGFVLELDGLGQGIIEYNSNNQLLFEFPMSLGTTVTDIFSGTFTANGNTESADGESWVTADGTGTLMLANGVTYTDVLRIKTIDTIYTSVNPGVPLPVTIAREQFEYYKASESSFPLFSHSTFDVINAVFPVTFGVVLSSVNPEGFVGLEESTVREFALYPNPSTGLFTVSLPAVDSKATIVVYNAIGNIVQSVKPTSLDTTIDLSNESKGIYFVKMQTEVESKTMKVIVR